ncbi:MAG: acyl-CoA thioesterase [Rhizobiaceae bacterium]
MPSAMEELLAILDLEELEHNLFRGRSPKDSLRRIYGGQVIAQALVAAQRTVPADRFVHSMHCYFILAGDATIPVVYQVERLRDGGSFTTRRVTAIQRGAAIFSMETSFQVEEDGLSHQVPMPLDVPPPEGLRSQRELLAVATHVPETIRAMWARERPLEIKPVMVEHYTSREKLAPVQYNWIRMTGTVPGDRRIQTAMLGYMSDMTLLDTSTFAHGRTLFDADIQAASLDHAMWFHGPHPMNDWVLYAQDSPSSSGSRGFSRGLIYSRDGTLIASTAQEGLMRLRTKPEN